MSFVIPVLNEERRLSPLLARLRQNFPGCELIVVDGGSRDKSVAEALRLADSVLLSAPGRATQMNLGAACARGQWLGFLHADTDPMFDQSMFFEVVEPSTDWAFCRVSLQGTISGLAMVSAFMNGRSRLTRVATGDQLLFVRRSVFTGLCGFRDIPLMEDVEICKRLRRQHGGGIVRLMVRASGRRWEQQGLWRTIIRMWALRLAFVMGVSPARLWSHYYGKHSVSEVSVNG